jgi:hypothetical protein
MNGASAELSANTISTPKSSIITTMGKSQNFFRSRKKAHSSSNKDKFSLLALEHAIDRKRQPPALKQHAFCVCADTDQDAPRGNLHRRAC